MEKARQQWPSRWIFILAAVGSAAGLGNLWRFPYLAFEHGGGAFVFALIIANLIVGIPLLALEVGLGQMSQKGAPDALAALKKPFKYIGWFAVMMAMLILSYYMAVVGWGLNYLAASFNLAWESDPSGYFFKEILQLSDGVASIGGISWPVLTGVIIAYIAIYFSVWKGVSSVSKVIKWTATIPFVILALLIVRAVTLDGAMDGLKLFFLPQWSALSNPELWIAAFSQVFFSLSLGAGIMIAYSSYNKKDSKVMSSVWWIAAGNFLVSLMSGVVVFGTLGYMAAQQSLPIAEVVKGGPSLAFIVFPTAISLLPALNTLIAVVFFIMIFTLAVDSAFSVLEAFVAPISDRFKKVSHKKLVFIITLIGFVMTLPFTTKAGLYYLDILDHFVTSYGLVLVGILEALAVGWLCVGNKLQKFINDVSTMKAGWMWSLSIKLIIPGFLGYLLVMNTITEINTPYEGYPTWALIYIGALPIILAPIIGAVCDWFTRERA